MFGRQLHLSYYDGNACISLRILSMSYSRRIITFLNCFLLLLPQRTGFVLFLIRIASPLIFFLYFCLAQTTWLFSHLSISVLFPGVFKRLKLKAFNTDIFLYFKDLCLRIIENRKEKKSVSISSGVLYHVAHLDFVTEGARTWRPSSDNVCHSTV